MLPILVCSGRRNDEETIFSCPVTLHFLIIDNLHKWTVMVLRQSADWCLSRLLLGSFLTLQLWIHRMRSVGKISVWQEMAKNNGANFDRIILANLEGIGYGK